MGYVPASKAGAELLFDVIASAYERNSLVLTTDLPFENWTEYSAATSHGSGTGSADPPLPYPGDQGRELPLRDAKRRRRPNGLVRDHAQTTSATQTNPGDLQQPSATKFGRPAPPF